MWTERGPGMAPPVHDGDSALPLVEWAMEETAARLDDIDHDGCFHAPYMNRGWIEAWAELQGGFAAAGFRMAVGWHEKRPVIAAPFQISRIGGLRVARIAAADYSDYCAPAIDRAFRQRMPAGATTAIWHQAARLLEGIDAISLRKLVEDPRLLTQAGDPGYVSIEPQGGHYTELDGDWERIGDRYFPKSTRQKLARKQRALAATGPVVCREANGISERLALLEQMIAWKSQQLSHLGASNPFDGGALPELLRAFARRAGQGECRVFVLEAGERPLAVTVLSCTPMIWGQYQTAYVDGPEAKHSPGQLLQQHIMREAAASGVQIYDFGYGDEEYKQRYCERHVVLYRQEKALSLAGRAYVAASHVGAQAVMLLKKDKRLRPVALAASQFAARFRPSRRA